MGVNPVAVSVAATTALSVLLAWGFFTWPLRKSHFDCNFSNDLEANLRSTTWKVSPAAFSIGTGQLKTPRHVCCLFTAWLSIRVAMSVLRLDSMRGASLTVHAQARPPGPALADAPEAHPLRRLGAARFAVRDEEGNTTQRGRHRRADGAGLVVAQIDGPARGAFVQVIAFVAESSRRPPRHRRGACSMA